MKICVDARCLNRPFIRGIGRLVTEVIQRAPASIDWLLLGDRFDFPRHQPANDNLCFECFGEVGYRLHAWEQIVLPFQARRARADLLLCPANIAPLVSSVPVITIVHDVIEWKTEFAEPGGFYMSQVLPRAFHQSAEVITVSKSSADDILELWPKLAPNVIYNGVGEEFLTCDRELDDCELAELSLQKPFCLYLGGEIPRKRFDWAVEVWKPFASDVQLATCGIAPAEMPRLLRSLNLKVSDQVRCLNYIPDTLLSRLLRTASCILYPTLYEGFGLPVVECNAVGTPILYSPCGSLRELQGPTSVLLPSDDLSGWRHALRAAVINGAVKNAVSESRDWAKSFSWDSTAEQYVAAFQRIAC
jgi:glycosyltransferase involved in cell wall biosynthesis